MNHFCICVADKLDCDFLRDASLKKRGEKEATEESICERVVRLATNIRNRQSKACKQGQDAIRDFIERYNQCENKILFVNVTGLLDEVYTGLTATRIAEEYTRPCLLLRKRNEDETLYGGSGRNTNNGSIDNLKSFLESTGCFESIMGHENAFGVEIKKENIPKAKAAQRIVEATGHEASTIHRLLGWNGKSFIHDNNNPLTADVVILDEASMVNVELFYDLIRAVKPGGRLIVCGDNRQLPPIGAGNVFSDVLDKTNVFNILMLTKVMRQALDSGILMDANKIRMGINPIKEPELKIISGKREDEHEAFGGGHRRRLYCRLTSFSRSLQINLRINLDGTKGCSQFIIDSSLIESNL